MIRPWPPLRINWPGRYWWTCIAIVWLRVAVLIAATAVAQAPSDLLKKDGPVANQEPITPNFLARTKRFEKGRSSPWNRQRVAPLFANQKNLNSTNVFRPTSSGLQASSIFLSFSSSAGRVHL
jgi:hypothetical protein